MSKIHEKKVLIMSGFPGSGKSTLAKKIAKDLGFQYLSSDVIRKELFDSDRFEKRGHDFIQKISAKVYEELYSRAISLAKSGKKVIIDGTHLHTDKRLKSLSKILDSIAHEHISFVVAKTRPDTIEERMKLCSKEEGRADDFFDSWKRVFTFFVNDMEKGLITWPDSGLGVAVVDSEDVYEQLAK